MSFNADGGRGMNAAEIRNALDEQIGDFETDRAYLGMSAISECPLVLYRRFLAGGRDRPPLDGLRLCHEGYLHEHDIIDRLEKAGLPISNIGMEITDLDTRIKGHIDCVLDGSLIEIKTVTSPAFDEIVRTGRAKRRHFEQAQMYMHYGGWKTAYIIYKERSTGALFVADVRADCVIGQRPPECIG
jgi:hypothetical protein